MAYDPTAAGSGYGPTYRVYADPAIDFHSAYYANPAYGNYGYFFGYYHNLLVYSHNGTYDSSYTTYTSSNYYVDRELDIFLITLPIIIIMQAHFIPITHIQNFHALSLFTTYRRIIMHQREFIKLIIKVTI